MGFFENAIKTTIDTSKKMFQGVSEETKNTIKSTIKNLIVEDQPKSNSFVIGNEVKKPKETKPKTEKLNFDDSENIEHGIVAKINEVTDLLNSAYNRDTNKNDFATNIADACNYLIEATSLVGTETTNEMGKMLNESWKKAQQKKEEQQEFAKKLQTIVEEFKKVI